MSVKLQHPHSVRVVHGKRIIQSRETCRIKVDDNPPITIQDGSLFWENGEVVSDGIPQWFWAEYKKLPKDKQEALGVEPNKADIKK